MQLGQPHCQWSSSLVLPGQYSNIWAHRELNVSFLPSWVEKYRHFSTHHSTCWYLTHSGTEYSVIFPQVNRKFTATLGKVAGGACQLIIKMKEHGQWSQFTVNHWETNTAFCVCEIPMVEIPLAMFEGKSPTPHYSATPPPATKWQKKKKGTGQNLTSIKPK